MANPFATGGHGGPKAGPPSRTPDYLAKGKDPYLAIGASLILKSARFAMDDYAREIFDLWFGGIAPAEVVFDNERWAAYMRAEQHLPEQIRKQLRIHADARRSEVDNGTGRLQSAFQLPPFHAEVGSASGGYSSGYDVLHGSNKAAGDFQVAGTFKTYRPGPPGTGFTVTYEQLAYTFNDIVDINKRWSSDVTLGRVATNMARSMGSPPPRDYTLRIRWRADQPVRIDVAATPVTPGRP